MTYEEWLKAWSQQVYANWEMLYPEFPEEREKFKEQFPMCISAGNDGA